MATDMRLKGTKDRHEHSGAWIPYINTTPALIPYGTCMFAIPGCPGVASTDIPVGEEGAIHRNKVWRLDKAAGVVVNLGDELFLENGVLTPTPLPGTHFVFAIAWAAADAAHALVIAEIAPPHIQRVIV